MPGLPQEQAGTQVRADKGVRAAGYLIDLLPALLAGLFGLIPIVGAVLVGLLLTPYWLLRDITGASLGKLLLGLKVIGKDGSPASKGALVLRNLPIAIGPALMIIPLLGYVLAPIVSMIIMLVEVIFLLTQGERVGDRLAKTVVVTK